MTQMMKFEFEGKPLTTFLYQGRQAWIAAKWDGFSSMPTTDGG